MAATQYSIRVVKKFNYRGDPLQEFSNRYHFDGTVPADDTAWNGLCDAVVAAEKAIYLSSVTIIAVHGYGPSSEAPVHTSTYSQAGTLAVGAAVQIPGDCAAVLRMATTKKSIKNHTVYVMSYFHGALVNGSSGDGDTLFGAQKTAVDAYGNSWLNGFTVGARTYKRTTPDGHATTGRLTSPFIGHRDFPH